jgi:deazaflavin-dependent oxidoreductase (nitroreductase family)
VTSTKSEVATPASGGLVKVISSGRRTGLPHIVSVRFVYHDGAFFVMGGKSGADWVRNSLDAGTVRLRLGEAMYEASVKLANPQERSETLIRFSKKYGTWMTNGWYASSEVCLKLSPSGSPSRRGAATGEGGAKTSFADWNRAGRGYYGEVAGAFDSASEEYDYTIGNNFINMWIRKRSIQVLLDYARQDDVALEVGCGTGAEAMEISNHVAGVVATDISAGMIALLSRKVNAKRAGGKVSVLKLGAAEISQAATSLPGGKTRLAYSFNGALNCEPSIERVPSELAKVIEPGGHFVCSIRNTLCLSEALVHGLFLQFDRMAPRKRQPIMVSVGGQDIPSYYYSPSRFVRFFSPLFRVRRTMALPAILPPAYLSDAYFRARGVLSFAERIERATAGTFPFNRFGDQTLFVFQKK